MCISQFTYMPHLLLFTDPNNKVARIATCYGLGDPGFKPCWGQVFRHPSRLTLWPTKPPVEWVSGFLLGSKVARGMVLTTHPLLMSRLSVELYFYSMECYRVTFTFFTLLIICIVHLLQCSILCNMLHSPVTTSQTQTFFSAVCYETSSNYCFT